ncbi:MAG: polyprenyl synthetase family protein [Lachnospiraceae bacterium]|nr:polyprenyl synthetase family protein [Lachnospiraceae bacterium]
MDFEKQMNDKVVEIENVIQAYMPKEYTFQKTIIDAMDYTMSAGGKRIRPMLMKACYDLFGGTANVVEPFMAAIEMIHTYSLIHDDLPALDNDDYRRGRKTAHIVYGEDMAILAGDALLNYAFETATKAFDLIMSQNLLDIDTETIANDTSTLYVYVNELKQRKSVERALQVLSSKPGIYGMIGGQVVDVELTGSTLTEEQLVYIYENKTGALIESSMMIGAILAGVDESTIEKIQKVAYNIGMAFQIQDDILDETSTFEELGKALHSDEKNGKVTYVTIHGIKESRNEIEKLSREAIEILESMDGDSEFLQHLIEYLIDRKN